VSFKAAARLNPDEAAALVKSHEYEHVSHERARAKEEGRKVVSQSVTIQTSVCPECGRVYVSGGQTRTVTRGGEKEPPKNERPHAGADGKTA
jgi:uncharacterized protein with PIN domain